VQTAAGETKGNKQMNSSKDNDNNNNDNN